MTQSSSKLRKLDKEIATLKKSKPKTSTEKAKLAELKSEFSKLYNQVKRQVLKFEETNMQYLILMPSTNGFYKMFEHSALFYALQIAPQLNLHANLQIDKDYDQKSQAGFVAFRDLKVIEPRLEQLRIERGEIAELSSELVIFHLPWEFKEDQVERLITLNDSRIREFNELVLPVNVIPVLFYGIMTLNEAIYQNVRRMHPVERELYGIKIGTEAADLMQSYLKYAGGAIEEEEYVNSSIDLLMDLKYRVKLVTDLKVWEPRVTARVAKEMIKVLDILKNEARRIVVARREAEKKNSEEGEVEDAILAEVMSVPAKKARSPRGGKGKSNKSKSESVETLPMFDLDDKNG